MRRAFALWLVLFAAYAAMIGLPAFGDAQFGGDEPHFLLTADSIVHDHDLDVRNQYATAAYRDFYPYVLERTGRLTNGQANEPYGVGFALVIAPAYALGGSRAVQVFLAAIAALAFTLASRIALRVVPEPWASGTAFACGLSPPALAYATTVTPELTAGALLALAILLALKARELPRIRWIVAAAFALGALPWLGLQFLVAGLIVAFAMFHWLRRRARGFAQLVELEVLLFSGIMFVTINDQLFGGFTPGAAALPGDRLGDLGAADFADRLPRLVALWLDRTHGALRWAPVTALAFYALWLLWRSRRDHIARVLPERRDVEITATLCALVCAGQVFVATFVAPTMFGFSFPGRNLVAALPIAVALVAWGLRQAPRVGSVLVVVTLATSVWWYAELRLAGGDLLGPSSRAPLGPLDRLLPLFDTGSAAAALVLAAAALAVAGLVGYELHRARARLDGL